MRARTCQFVDFAVPVDHRVKIKENKKRGKYLDFAKELKNLWKLKVTVIPIVIGALGSLEELEIERQVETIQTAALLRLARIRSRILET